LFLLFIRREFFNFIIKFSFKVKRIQGFWHFFWFFFYPTAGRIDFRY
jgi:hypothetical protein